MIKSVRPISISVPLHSIRLQSHLHTQVTSILSLDPITQQRTRQPISNAQISKLASLLANEPYKLLSTEIAGIINQIPRTSIELCLIVEEGEERFKEEELEEMVELVKKYLVEGVEGVKEVVGKEP